MIKRIVFLCSGGGGNLRFIYECQNIGLVPYTIAGVIADRKCNAITFASLKSIPNFIIDYDESPDVENDIKKILNEMKPDLIVTTIHKILGKRLLDSFGNIFINLHYSYLPAYKGLIGMRPVDLAVKLKAAFIGTTCHFVDEDVDSGEIITQGIICLNTTKDIYNKVFECGAITLLGSIQKLFSAEMKDKIEYDGIILSPFPKHININDLSKLFVKFHESKEL